MHMALEAISLALYLPVLVVYIRKIVVFVLIKYFKYLCAFSEAYLIHVQQHFHMYITLKLY